MSHRNAGVPEVGRRLPGGLNGLGEESAAERQFGYVAAAAAESYESAAAYLGIGDNERAIALLNQAVEKLSNCLNLSAQ
jgi:hypothetical protein